MHLLQGMLEKLAQQQLMAQIDMSRHVGTPVLLPRGPDRLWQQFLCSLEAGECLKVPNMMQQTYVTGSCHSQGNCMECNEAANRGQSCNMTASLSQVCRPAWW